jgi:cytochrome c554/c'-like protein
MVRIGTCGRCLLAGVVCAAALAWGRSGYGDDKPAPPRCDTPLVAPAMRKPLVQDDSVCGNCHSQPPPKSSVLKPLCRCNELTFWTQNDKHQDAFAALDDPRAVRMCKALNAGPPREAADCLGCHSIATINTKVAIKDVKKPYLEHGVSCLACHGPYGDWIDVHGTSIDDKRICWRQLTRKTKQDDWGMTDLWDPANRTKVCASCHIGDPDPDKHRFVTHEMYAAGHPPLPAFETVAFCDGLPRHWQLLNEKSPEMQEQDYRWNPRELEQTKLAVIGQAAAFREAVNLLADKAEKTPAGQGLDFALFDCSACHHDLKQPSWRQQAGYDGPPGRPGVRRWSPAALDLCVWYAGDTDDGRGKLSGRLAAGLKDLRAAFLSRPYGDAREAGMAGRALVEWADKELLPRLNAPASGDAGATRYDVAAALALLKHLAGEAADPAPGRTPDYDGARQTAWTFRAIYEDARRALEQEKDKGPDDAKARQALREAKPGIDAQLAILDKALDLTLPNSKPVSDEEYAKDKEAVIKRRRDELNVFLPVVLEHTADYDPDKVQKAFAEIAKLLP